MKLLKKHELKIVKPRQNLTEQIYQEIKQNIFSLRLLPGDRFSEQQIAEQVNASRTPVREALIRLQREGFVSVSLRSGWQVNPFDLAQFEQLYDVRTILEMAAVKHLCSTQTTTDIDELTRIEWIVPEDRLIEGKCVCAHEECFHKHLVAVAGNAEMIRIHHDICERLQILQCINSPLPHCLKTANDEHRKFLQAINERREDDANTLLMMHTENRKAELREMTLLTLYKAQNASEL